MVYDKQHMIHFAFLLFLLFFEPTFQQQDSPSSSRAEQAALLELRSSLGLRTKEWPIKLHPCIGWKGIKCINGRVTDINIGGFRRTSIGRKNPQFAVESLANLTLLQSFNASNFILPGVIPEWFGHQLSLLQVLDLRSCSIFGSIPSSLASLRHLSRLDLSSNYLSGSIPPGVGSLLKLRYLNLSKNMLSSSIPAQLGGLVSLLDLDLSVNSLSGTLPLELRGLTSLRSMVLRSNSLDGSLSDGLFRTLTRLQSLDLKDNNFTGLIPDGLWSMSGLQLLDVSRNSFTGLLPNYSSSFNITDAVLSVSQNAFYGSLTIISRRFSVIDLSGNYFEGNVPDYLPTDVSFVSNCLQNVSRQRTLAVCTSFYSARGLIFDTFGFLEPTEHPIAEVSSKKSNRNGVILGSVIGGSVVIFLIVLLILIFLWRRKRRTTNRRRGVVGPVLPTEAVEPTPRLLIDYPTFKYDELVRASNGFSDLNLVKHGHSGDFFYGVLQNGIRVVIKRVDLRRANDGYLVELELLSKVSNVRLVPFIGECLENENEKFLVYKFLPNGDLSASLFKKVMSDEDCLQSLDWITRLKIALGAAEVRLGSLSHVCGQQGEAQPSRSSKLLRLPQSSEEASLGLQTAVCTYDVYCFGKVLLELVTGKLGVSAVPDAEINEWLDQTLPCININNKELVTTILDPSLIVDDDLLEEAWAVAVVAKSCLNPKPSRRPVMKYILKALENPLKVVREENSSSRQLRSTSIGSSWNASLFGSWHQSLSDVTRLPSASLTKAGGSSFKRSGTMGSQGSDRNGGSERSSSRRRHSKEIFPEPAEVQGIERLENK
ncbi:putative LRR receptor-like serine/threonine-protein kinase, partial [Cucurbita argyrosperma subsp. sororia]